MPTNRLATIATGNTARILTLDIETRPSEAYVWGLWKQNIGLSQLMEHGHVMCFVAKWYGDETPIFKSDYHDGHDAMILAAWNLLNDADIVITYNGVAFDLPHLRREFALAGLNPPAPWRDIDLIKTVRREFNFVSNKLANVVDELNVGGKMSTGGFDLWRACIAGDADAWATMRDYNTTDVHITEALYTRLRPWIKNHPHMGLWSTRADACPACGSPVNITDTGRTTRTAVQAYPAATCTACGTQVRGTRTTQTPLAVRNAR